MTEQSQRSRAGGLTRRQIIVLSELAAGSSYHHIARRIGFSVSTVRNEAVAIYRMLGVHGRVAAAARAAEFGIDPTGTAGGSIAS